ncbi:MAG: Sec-independent protein translocase protein TatB [Rhodocyclaceae bacterium]|jgi:sec-independent protein translocase protein TatB|nr:Sec-independent protein translocase protein TatB [Rhodocyclaceae bacterium]
MFDIGFSELMVIGLVALIVIGPERLPKVARTVGHLLGRLQRYVSDVKSDIQREVQLDELKNLQQQAVESARELEDSLRGQISAVEADVGQAAAAAAAALALNHSPVASSPPAPEAKVFVTEPDSGAIPESPMEIPGEPPSNQGQLELLLDPVPTGTSVKPS